MSSELALKIQNLSKCYHIYAKPHERLLQMMMRGRRQYFREFWSVRDVSFEVNKGETVGILGRNGSGKSTLLQMICGTLNPTSGSIETKGRIAALLELGSGFNPEFTGRENVYVSGAVLGLSKEEIDNRFDDIAAFADIGSFIEQPVKTYSSGMFVRLAFSVNMMSNPDIMVIDEALAVGDMAFQAKCMTALKRMQDNGVTVLFVSHDIGGVKSLCSKAIHLDHGEIRSMGKASHVAEEYVRVMREEMNLQSQSEQSASRQTDDTGASSNETSQGSFKVSDEFDRNIAQFRYGKGGARITYAELLDMDDAPLASAVFDQKVKIRIYFTTDVACEISPNYYIHDDKKNAILGAGPRTIGEPLINSLPGERHIVTYTTSLPLQEGNYSIHLELSKPLLLDQAAEFLDVIDDAIVFNVQRKEAGRIWAKVYLPNSVEAERV